MSHEATDLDLADGDSVVLTGAVGAGKTTFVEAFTWCVWDRTRGRTLDSLIRDGASECSVTVVLDVDGHEARVTRSRARGRDSALSLTLDGVQDTRHTAAETRKAVIDLVGLDYEAALAGPLMVQKGRAFMEAPPRERKDLLIRLFGLDRWQAWEDAAKARRDGAIAAVRASKGAIAAASPTLDDDLAVAAQALRGDNDMAGEASAWLSENEPALVERERQVAAMRERGSRATAAQEALRAARERFAEERRAYDSLRNAAIEAEAAVERFRAAPRPDAVDDAALAAAEEGHARAGQALADANAHLSAMKALRQFQDTDVACPHCGKVYPIKDALDSGLLERVRLADEAVGRAMDAYRESARPPEEMRRRQADGARWDRDEERLLREYAAARDRHVAQDRLMVELQARGRALAAEYEAVRADAEALPAAEAALAQMRSDAGAQRGRLSRAQAAAAEHARMADRMQAERDRRDAAQAALREQEREHLVWDVLAEGFGRDGAPALILDGLVPRIEAAANEVLDRTPGGLSLRLRTQRATRAGMAETLDAVVVTEDGDERDYEMLSGGQQFRVDLAIRLALTGLLAGRAADFLIVDEGLDRFQDDEGRRAVLDTLAQMRAEFGLLLAISHHREVVEFFDRRVEVEMEGKVSRVREAA